MKFRGCSVKAETITRLTIVGRDTKTWNDMEVRLNDDGSIDEIVAHGVNVHLEQMDDGFWWMGIYRGDTLLHVHFGTEQNRSITVTAESDDGELSCGYQTATGRAKP